MIVESQKLAYDLKSLSNYTQRNNTSNKKKKKDLGKLGVLSLHHHQHFDPIRAPRLINSLLLVDVKVEKGRPSHS